VGFYSQVAQILDECGEEGRDPFDELVDLVGRTTKVNPQIAEKFAQSIIDNKNRKPPDPPG